MIDMEQIAQYKGKIEAALFITRRPLAISEIAEIIGITSDETELALMELLNDYAFRENSALEIDDTDGYILQVRESCSDVVHKMMPAEISEAALQTLSAIAIKAPVLQSDLIEFRGSTAYEHIHELLAKKLISKRRQGRSFLLNTTRNFNEYFKLAADKKELQYLVHDLKKPRSQPKETDDDAPEDLQDFDEESFDNTADHQDAHTA